MTNLTFQMILVENNQIGRIETVSSIREATAFLLTGWPRKKASLYLDARVACYEAQAGLVSVEAARLIFVEAALEADIYVHEGSSDLHQTLQYYLSPRLECPHGADHGR